MGDVEEGARIEAMLVIDGVWNEVRQSLFVARETGEPLIRLPDLSEKAAAAKAERGRALLARANAVDLARLPQDIADTLAVARLSALQMAKAADWYWLVFDPLQVGFFSMFAPTAYGGGFLLSIVNGCMAAHPLTRRGDVDRYLGLVEDYGALVRQFEARTRGQAERGIIMPAAQLEQALVLVDKLRKASSALVPSGVRLSEIGSGVAEEIAARVRAVVDPAFVSLLAMLSDPGYAAAAPETVGLGQYPGGDAVYRELVELHLTVPMTVQAVHAAGHSHIARIRGEMQALLASIGFDGNERDYLTAIENDPAWRESTPQGISARFQRYIDRLAPKLSDLFDFQPGAPYGVEALPAELSGSMTFGYYDPPTADRPRGRYLFNAANLAGGSLANIAALTYHELAPGHHFHIASQRENAQLHPLRSYAFINAFNEGWAEYAATLAGEVGMYASPEERFGRLVMDAFLTCRLVVDTGMNALGWSLEQARAYMRENAFMPETEVRSESIRYSCDLPAQALAYKFGEFFLRDEREAMRKTMAHRFDIRRFHNAVLRPGALPLAAVAANVRRAAASEDA